jgi:hypothetical protein
MTLRWDADFQDFRQDEPDTWEVTYSYRPGITKMALREYLVGIGPVRNECGSPSKNGISRIASGKESIPGNRKAKAETWDAIVSRLLLPMNDATRRAVFFEGP